MAEVMRIYDNIVKIAKEKKISINAIEKECELGIGSLCKWNTVSPTVRSLKKVSNCLDVSINILLENTTDHTG